LIPLPENIEDLRIEQFDMIWKFLNLDSQYDWRWLAGRVGLTQKDLKIIEGGFVLPSQGFLQGWSQKGATTKQLLELLAGYRVDIIVELAKTYIIP
jgi:hypothetical protein